MAKRLEDLDLPNRSNREAILLLFRVDTLQCDNLSSLLVLANKHTPIMTTNTVQAASKQQPKYSQAQTRRRRLVVGIA